MYRSICVPSPALDLITNLPAQASPIASSIATHYPSMHNYCTPLTYCYIIIQSCMLYPPPQVVRLCVCDSVLTCRPHSAQASPIASSIAKHYLSTHNYRTPLTYCYIIIQSCLILDEGACMLYPPPQVVRLCVCDSVLTYRPHSAQASPIASSIAKHYLSTHNYRTPLTYCYIIIQSCLILDEGACMLYPPPQVVRLCVCDSVLTCRPHSPIRQPSPVAMHYLWTGNERRPLTYVFKVMLHSEMIEVVVKS